MRRFAGLRIEAGEGGPRRDRRGLCYGITSRGKMSRRPREFLHPDSRTRRKLTSTRLSTRRTRLSTSGSVKPRRFLETAGLAIELLADGREPAGRGGAVDLIGVADGVDRGRGGDAIRSTLRSCAVGATSASSRADLKAARCCSLRAASSGSSARAELVDEALVADLVAVIAAAHRPGYQDRYRVDMEEDAAEIARNTLEGALP